MPDKQSGGTVSVSRVDLESICEHFEFGRHWQAMQGVEKLREILAQPAEQQDEPVGYVNSNDLIDDGYGLGVVSMRENPPANGFTDGGIPVPLYRRPAAQAVKLPPRRNPPPFEDGYDPSKDYDTNCGRSEGWNECRHETAKLNGIEP